MHINLGLITLTLSDYEDNWGVKRADLPNTTETIMMDIHADSASIYFFFNFSARSVLITPAFIEQCGEYIKTLSGVPLATVKMSEAGFRCVLVRKQDHGNFTTSRAGYFIRIDKGAV